MGSPAAGRPVVNATFCPASAERQQEGQQQHPSDHTAAEGEAARFAGARQKGQEAELLSLQPEQQQGAAETSCFQRYGN